MLKDLSYLAVRVLSIYLFILGLSRLMNILDFAIPTYLQILETDTTYLEVFFIIGIPSFILIISSVILWFFAEKLSLYLLPKDSRETAHSIQAKELEGFVLSIVGLLLVILSFTSVVGQVMNYINMSNQAVQFETQGNLFSFIDQAIRFLIGIVLLFKAEGFALFLRKIRNMGLKHVKQDTGS